MLFQKLPSSWTWKVLARKEAEGYLGSHLWGTSGKTVSKLAEGMATELGHWESSAVMREPELCDFPKVTCWDVLPNSNVGTAGQKVY